MMVGLAIENAEPIVLDTGNNTAEGPRGLFKIVVDEFSTDTIPAWHIEDRNGQLSRNLGGDDCKSLDAIVGRVSWFAFEDAMKQLRWTSPKRVNKLIRENEALREKIASSEFPN
jgi:hypothetical protein